MNAGLLARSLYLLQHIDHGIDGDVLSVALFPRPNAYRDIDNASYYPRLLETLAAIPGVRSVAAARMFPRVTIDFPGDPIAFLGDEPGETRAVMESVSPGFFETIGVPLLRGRQLTWADDSRSRPVAVISDSLARALAPDGNAVGRRVRHGSNRAQQDIEIVGVTRDVTLGFPRQPHPRVLYRPMLQVGLFANYPRLAIAVNGDATAVATQIRRVIDEAGREHVVGMAPISSLLARAPSSERMIATLSATVAGLAALLAFIGVYGLLAYSVTRRRREIGVRVAIGASRQTVLRMVMRDGLVLTAAGVVIGLPAAIVVARGLRTLFFGVTEADPWTLGSAVVFFAALGALAGLVPARRAASTDPATVLRND